MHSAFRNCATVCWTSISCSSGTYIRSIANDLGEKLGCGAHLETLRRTRIGLFQAADAVSLERFEAMSEAQRLEPPHAVPLARVPFPFEKVKLASLEAWKASPVKTLLVGAGQPEALRVLAELAF